MNKKYSWPASKLDEKDMLLLFKMREKKSKPITLLIKEAINKTYGK